MQMSAIIARYSHASVCMPWVLPRRLNLTSSSALKPGPYGLRVARVHFPSPIPKDAEVWYRAADEASTERAVAEQDRTRWSEATSSPTHFKAVDSRRPSSAAGGSCQPGGRCPAPLAVRLHIAPIHGRTSQYIARMSRQWYITTDRMYE